MNLKKMDIRELSIARNEVIESLPALRAAHKVNDDLQLTDDADTAKWLKTHKALDNAEMLECDLDDLIKYKSQISDLEEAVANITSKY